MVSLSFSEEGFKSAIFVAVTFALSSIFADFPSFFGKTGKAEIGGMLSFSSNLGSTSFAFSSIDGFIFDLETELRGSSSFSSVFSLSLLSVDLPGVAVFGFSACALDLDLFDILITFFLLFTCF